MVWKFSGERPIYQQIIEHIESAVISGEYAPGERIPSVRDLATAAQVNPNTMQHALHELEQRSILITVGTSGRFVTSDSKILEAMRDNKLQELTSECAMRFAAFGLRPSEAAQRMLALDEERKGE